MKILRIIARLNIGGPARNAILLTERLEGSCFKTVLICGEIEPSEGDMRYLAVEKGIEPLVVPELGRELSFRDDWRAFWKIYRIICKEKPDIIHTHTAKAGTVGRIAGMLYRLLHRFALRNDIPLCHCEAVGRSNLNRPIFIHTFHGHVLHSYFGKFKSWLFIWIERFLARFTDKIVVVSEALKKELVEIYRIAPEEKFCVVPLGLELDGLFDLELPSNSMSLINQATTEYGVVAQFIGQKEIRIGIVGRLVPVKNHKMLFRVAERICSNNNVKFVVIGDGETREELERYVGELGISDIVEFKGWIRDLCEIYKGLDIVVLTSLNEGTPVSLIEAMAAGRPVVATKVGGVAEVVEDGKSGYLVTSEDIEGFAEKLLNFICDPEKRRSFGECGRTFVRAKFSKERLIRDMEGLYNKCLNNERTKR